MCYLKNFFFSVFFSLSFFSLKPESEQGRRTSLEKFTRSVVSSAGFLWFFGFLSVFLGGGCRFLREGREPSALPSAHPPMVFCECRWLLS